MPEALTGTSPYLNEHLNRFGRYELDLSKPPVPLRLELPPRLRPSRQGAAAPCEVLVGIVAMAR